MLGTPCSEARAPKFVVRGHDTSTLESLPIKGSHAYLYSAGTSDILGKTKALNLVKPEDTGTNTLLSL